MIFPRRPTRWTYTLIDDLGRIIDTGHVRFSGKIPYDEIVLRIVTGLKTKAGRRILVRPATTTMRSMITCRYVSTKRTTPCPSATAGPPSRKATSQPS